MVSIFSELTRLWESPELNGGEGDKKMEQVAECGRTQRKTESKHGEHGAAKPRADWAREAGRPAGSCLLASQLCYRDQGTSSFGASGSSPVRESEAAPGTRGLRGL